MDPGLSGVGLPGVDPRLPGVEPGFPSGSWVIGVGLPGVELRLLEVDPELPGVHPRLTGVDPWFQVDPGYQCSPAVTRRPLEHASACQDTSVQPRQLLACPTLATPSDKCFSA